MPMKSKSQRAWMWANDPKMAKKWEKHTPKGAKLPDKVAVKEALAKLAVVAAPAPGVGASMGIPGPMKIQPQASQPAQSAAGALPTLPGANDHPSAQQGAGAPPAAPQGPQPIKATPGQPINAADATAMARQRQILPPQAQIKAAAIHLRLLGGALKQVL